MSDRLKALRRVKAVQDQIKRMADAELAQRAERVTEAGRRHKLIERRIAELDSEARRAAERTDLQRLLDAYLARPADPD